MQDPRVVHEEANALRGVTSVQFNAVLSDFLDKNRERLFPPSRNNESNPVTIDEVLDSNVLLRESYIATGILTQLQGKDLKQIHRMMCVNDDLETNAVAIAGNTVDSDSDSEAEEPIDSIEIAVHRYQFLHSFVRKVYFEGNMEVSKCNFFLRNELGSHMPSKSIGERTRRLRPFKSLVTKASICTYADLVYKLLITLLNLSVLNSAERETLGVRLSDQIIAKVCYTLSSVKTDYLYRRTQ